MKVLIIGRGGRESAIVKKTLLSKKVSEVFCAPGNAQTAKICNNVDINELEIEKLVKFVKDNQINLTIVGPESSLEAGIVDKFIENNLKIFGPTKKATIIESSKSYAKGLMEKYGIPTAAYEEFTNSEQAIKYAKRIKYPHVIKYDGLAAGKGVVICEDYKQLKKEIINMLDDNIYGSSSKIILEEFLQGEEFTLLSLVKDERVYPLEVSRDYKRAFDNDKGLNTGGMGAICPFDKISENSKNQAIDILNKTAKAMVAENNNFCGVLYGGFIDTPDGVKVIEYNARFGDPETEVVLQRLDNDLIEEIDKLLNGEKLELKSNNNYYVGVTLAAQGYPQEYKKGIEISNYDDEGIFHMGTKISESKILSDGGRVVFVSAKGDSLEQAIHNAYKKIEKFENLSLFYRKDIGK